MFGTDSRLNPIEARKRLLIAESEINRARLPEEWQQMSKGIHTVGARLKSIGWVAATAALAATSISAFRPNKTAATQPKTTWMHRLLQGAQLASSIWSAFRSRSR
ncbi:MAG TPA: hypothetical protein VGE41_08540 [Verrucomicrobiae bacterium]|jgi:hypothetical protein